MTDRTEDIGKKVASSKKRIKWIFTFSEDDDEHEVMLLHSTMSGKKQLLLNRKLLYESRKVASSEWNYGWTMGKHICRCDIKGEGKYDLSIDSVPYKLWPRLDPQFQAQIQAAKVASEKSYAEDELHRMRSGEVPSKSNGKGGKRRGSRESRASIPTLSQANTTRDSSTSRVTPVDKARRKKTPSPASDNLVTVDLLSSEVQGEAPPYAPAQVPGNKGPFGQFSETTTDQERGAHVLQLGAQFQQLNVGHEVYPVTTTASFLPPPSDNAPVPPTMPNTELFLQEQHENQELRRVNSLDKDLWEVAAEKDFVNMNDLTGQRRNNIEPLSKDQRTLAELANSQKVQQQPQQRKIAMNDPPAELPRGFYAEEQMVAMQPYGYPPQEAVYYPPPQHQVNNPQQRWEYPQEYYQPQQRTQIQQQSYAQYQPQQRTQIQQQPYAQYQPQLVRPQYVPGQSNQQQHQQGYPQQNW